MGKVLKLNGEIHIAACSLQALAKRVNMIAGQTVTLNSGLNNILSYFI